MIIAEKYYVPLLLLACLCLFFPHLDVLYENIMEARNFNTAREMLNHDNWILTTMNGEARYQKPPLPTWLVALSGGIFGFEAIWALRLPSAIIATIMVFFLYALSLRINLTKRQSFHNGLILATSFYILFSGRNGTWDIFAHAFMLGGIYFLFRFFSESQSVWKNAVLAGIFIGLSFMSKGPVSHYALFLPFLIAYFWVYKFMDAKRKIAPLVICILLIVVLSSWWAIAIYLLDGETAKGIADKETTAWANRNTRPFYYYWSFFTQSGIWTIPAFVGLLYPYLKTRVTHLKAYRFTLIWTLASVVLLSLIPEKKSRYLLPVLLPLAMNTGFYIEYLVSYFKNLRSKRELLPVYFNFGLIGVIGVVAPVVGFLVFGDYFNGLWLWYLLLSLSLISIGVFMLISLWRKRFSKVFYLTIGFVISVIMFGFRLVEASYTNVDYVDLSQEIDRYEAQGIPVYLFNNASPELIWDMGKRLPTLEKRGELSLPAVPPYIVLVHRDGEAYFKEKMEGSSYRFLQEVDGNKTAKADRNYKDRRVVRIYIVEP